MHLCPYTKGIGIQIDGCFAEYIVVPAYNVIEIPPYVSDDIASILDPLGNAVHTCTHFPLAGKNVLITGAGPIGLMSVLIAQFLGANHIAICDPNPERRTIANKYQPSLVYDPMETSVEEVVATLPIDEGFDVGLEMSGSENALASQAKALRPGGSLALLGIFPKNIQVDMNQLIFKGISIQGIYGRKMFHTWHQVFGLIEAGLDVSSTITHKKSFQVIDEAFSLMQKGASGKVLLNWQKAPLVAAIKESAAARV